MCGLFFISLQCVFTVETAIHTTRAVFDSTPSNSVVFLPSKRVSRFVYVHTIVASRTIRRQIFHHQPFFMWHMYMLHQLCFVSNVIIYRPTLVPVKVNGVVIQMLICYILIRSPATHGPHCTRAKAVLLSILRILAWRSCYTIRFEHVYMLFSVYRRD